jgi:hypothetical protein
MNLKEHQFSTETNFKRTTDEFRKNVIRSNDLARKQKVNMEDLRKQILAQGFFILTFLSIR